MEISDFPDKEFKVMSIKILVNLERRTDEQRKFQQKIRKYKKEPISGEEHNT